MTVFTEKELRELNEIKARAEKDAHTLERIERRLNNRAEKLWNKGQDELEDKLESVGCEAGHIAGQLRYRVASEILPLILSAK